MTPSDKLAAAEARRRFAGEVLRPDAEVSLARAALLVAAEEEPRRCDVEGCLRLLGELGEGARARIERAAADPVEAGARGAVEALNQYLFGELGFRGNEADYYDPRNSLLHHVLERRTGIPITLSIVYMEVGRRAGLSVEGVGLPGHFVVRAFEPGGAPVLVDPFNAKATDEEECQQRLDLIYGGRVTLGAEHLRAAGVREILARVLGNLKGVYAQAQMSGRALAAVERILLLSPHDLEERRDRGMLLAQLGRLPEAVADTQSYLNLRPDAPDAEAVREQLKKMRARLSMLN
jgi:regulator of sirC expression with transglutaminase-like and TPR domain